MTIIKAINKSSNAFAMAILVAIFFPWLAQAAIPDLNVANQTIEAAQSLADATNDTATAAELEKARKILEQTQTAIDQVTSAVSTVENVKKALESGDPAKALQAITTLAGNIKQAESAIKNLGQLDSAGKLGLDSKTQKTLDKINTVTSAIGKVTNAIQSGDPIAAVSAVVDLADQLKTTKAATDVLKGDVAQSLNLSGMGFGMGNFDLSSIPNLGLPQFIPAAQFPSFLPSAPNPFVGWTNIAGDYSSLTPNLTSIVGGTNVSNQISKFIETLENMSLFQVQSPWWINQQKQQMAADTAAGQYQQQKTKLIEETIADVKDSTVANYNDETETVYDSYYRGLATQELDKLYKLFSKNENSISGTIKSFAGAIFSPTANSDLNDGFLTCEGYTKPMNDWSDYLSIRLQPGCDPMFQIAGLITREAIVAQKAADATDKQIAAYDHGIRGQVKMETNQNGIAVPKITIPPKETGARVEQVVKAPYTELEARSAAIAPQRTPEGIGSGTVQEVLSMIQGLAQQIFSLGTGIFGQKLASGEASTAVTVTAPSEADAYSELTATADLKITQRLLGIQGVLRDNSTQLLTVQPLPLDLLNQKKNSQVRLLSDLKSFYLNYASSTNSSFAGTTCLPTWTTVSKENGNIKLSIDETTYLTFDKNGKTTKESYSADAQIEQTKQQLAKMPSLLADIDLAFLSASNLAKNLVSYLGPNNAVVTKATPSPRDLIMCYAPPCNGTATTVNTSAAATVKPTPEEIIALKNSTIEFGRQALVNRSFISRSADLLELETDTNNFNYTVVREFSLLSLDLPTRNKTIQDEINSLNSHISELVNQPRNCPGFGGIFR